MISSATFAVTLTDENDPPIITPGQVISFSEFTDSALPSSTLYPVLVGIVASFDEDKNETFNNGTAYTLLSGAAAATQCSQRGKWPTQDELSSGVSLFTIDAVTGGLTLTAMPTGTLWKDRTPTVFDSALVRASYEVCVKAVDVAGASNVALVTVNVAAALPAAPVIDSIEGVQPSPPTSGGTTITFRGANFWPGGVQPTGATALTASYRNDKGMAYAGVACAVPDNATITCRTAPGFDTGYLWTLSIGNIPVTPKLPLTMSYAEPDVTSLSANAKVLATPGGATISFFGENFGPSSFARPGYAYNYSNPRVVFGVHSEFTCAVTWWNDTVLQCRAPAGVGKDLPWTITVGSNSMSASAVGAPALLIAYLPPTITSVTGLTAAVNVSSLDTFGGQTVVIRGTNFGPATITWASDASVHTLLTDPLYGVTGVMMGGATGDLLRFASCTQAALTAHTTITCLIPAGVGVGHKVSIKISNQAGTTIWPVAGNGLSYKPPVLTGISGSGASSADTVGGQVVVISGRHFGPITFPVPTISLVSYGHVGDTSRYNPLASCSITTQTLTVSQMTCLTVPGVGKDLVWVVQIGGQSTTAASAELKSSYAAPQVFLFSDVGAVDAPTIGGDPVKIIGRNYGPMDAYTAALLSVNYGVLLTDGDVAFRTEIPSVRYIAAACVISVPHTELTCKTVEGAGKDMDWKVSVDGQASTNPTTSYHAPEVTDIKYASSGLDVTDANVNGGQTIWLLGSNFGPTIYGNTTRSLLQRVTFGRVGTEFAIKSPLVVDETKISLVLPPGIGENLRFQVVVADQASPASSATFSYARPEITMVTPNTGNTNSPTSSPTFITLKTKNLPLMDPSTLYRVVFGQKPFEVERELSAPTMSLAGIAARTNSDDGTVNTTFTLPEDHAGVGVGIQILIAQGSSANVVTATNVSHDLSAFNYADPIINSVIVTRALFYTPSANETAPGGDYVACPQWSTAWSCTGSNVFQVTLQGSNFGADPAVMDHNDGILRKVEIMQQNFSAEGYPSIPTLWSAGVPGKPSDITDTLYLQSWSHDVITAFVKVSAGLLRVTLTTTATWEQPLTKIEQSTMYKFENLNPTVSNVAGVIKDIPTTGSVTPITVRVEGIAGANDLKIFIGGDHSTGTEAIIVCPVGANLPDRTVPCPNVKSGIILPAASGSADVVFFVPAGQGNDQSIVVVTYTGVGAPAAWTPKPSTGKDNISYKAPEISGFLVKLASDNAWSAAASAVPAGPSVYPQPTVTVPTDGTAEIRVYGSNLGSAPEIILADGYTVPYSAVRRCDEPGQEHSCIYFRAPAGEGSGTQPEVYTYGPIGYTMLVIHPDSRSNAVPLRYAAPVVTGIVSSTGSFPTEGGVRVTISGSNFGQLSNPIRQIPVMDSELGIAIRFRNLDGAGAVIACSDVIRLSHTKLNCTLPEGAGGKLDIAVIVAGIAGGSAAGAVMFGYARPVISHAYILSGFFGNFTDAPPTHSDLVAYAGNGVVIQPRLNSATVRLTSPTLGGALLVVEGVNFGVRDAKQNCVFQAWWNRDWATSGSTTQAFKCDAMETFLGEGEVPEVNIKYWSHRFIIFETIQGLGHKEIALSISGNELDIEYHSPNAVRLTYDAPSISSIVSSSSPSAATGPTEGKNALNQIVYIELMGSNFGPGGRDTRIPANKVSSFPVSLSVAPSLPTAYTVVIFHGSCVALPYDSNGAGITNGLSVKTMNGAMKLFTNDGTGCNNNGFQFANASKVSFALPPGVGAYKNVSLVVVDAQDDTDSFVQHSGSVNFGYDPPSISSLLPSPFMAKFVFEETTNSYSPQVMEVNLRGTDFGNYELADSQKWSPQERAISVSVAGVPCLTENMVVPGLSGGPFKGIYRTRETSRGNGASGPVSSTVVGCSLDPRTVPVGIINVTITIAGQSDFLASWAPTGLNDTNVPSGTALHACAAGGYAKLGETCRPCPAQYEGTGILPGALCVGYIDKSSVPFQNRFPYPKPLKGWYNLNSSDANTKKWGAAGESQMGACPPDFQDGGRDVCIAPCDPPESCLGDNVCAYGYASKPPMWKCSSCDAGFYHQGYACVKCPDSPWALVIGFTLLVIFAGVVGYLLNQKNVNIAVISIGLDFFQVLAIFATSGVKWPPIVRELLHILSAFNLNIEIVAPECIVPDLSYKAKFWFIMLLPLSVGGLLLGGVWTSMWAYKALIQGRKKAEQFTHTPALVSSVMSLLYVLYLYLTRTVFDVFTCTPTFPPDGRLYMNVANKEQCGIPGGTQLTLMAYAVAGLIIYSFGYPAFIAYIIFKDRETAMMDQVLRAKGTGDDTLTNPMGYKLRMMFGRQYFQFKPDYIMWIMAIILRKFCIAITAVVFSKNASFQMAACLLVMFLAYSAQVMTRPYMGPGEFEEVQNHCNTMAFTNERYARIKTQIASVESRGRKKMRKNLLNAEGKIEASAILGVLTGWLFNYNTIEQIMIFCAVIVCLMGIMYQSNSTTSFYPGALDGVTAVVMITIIFAIIYYLTVVITEMVVLYNEEHSRKRAAAAVRSGAKKLTVSDGSPKGTRGRLVNTEGELNVGNVDSTTNPMMMNRGGDAKNEISVDDVMSQKTPPGQAVWLMMQQGYIEQARQLEAANNLLNAAKRAAQLREIGTVEDEEGEEQVASPNPIAAGKKKAFAPTMKSSPVVKATSSPSLKSAGSMRSSNKSPKTVSE